MVAGWFTEDATEEDFRLLGTRCSGCRTVRFPREDGHCRNPGCSKGELEETPLSKRGTVWSCTDGRYRPPPPYVSDPDSPLDSVHAGRRRAGRRAHGGAGAGRPGVGVRDLPVGSVAEVVPGVLDEDRATGTVHTAWHWRPVAATEAGD